MREPFDSEAVYHLYNRGVDRRVIFSSADDFMRFYESLYLFNDSEYRRLTGNPVDRDVLLADRAGVLTERNPLVSIRAFCLKKNHYHLLLKQVQPNGISRFLHAVAMGYTKYFNLKHDRTGRLFESSYQIRPVDHEEHLDLMIRYINLNVLDGTRFPWRIKHRPSLTESDWKEAFKALDGYPWSSHHAHMGNPQLLPVVDEEAVRKIFPSRENYISYLTQAKIT
jgi:putative transposase